VKEFKVKIKNLRGLHARAASRLVQVANRFQSDIRIIKDDVESDAKSILGVLLLAAAQGTELTVRIEGADESEAMEAIRDLFERGFYEEETGAPTRTGHDTSAKGC